MNTLNDKLETNILVKTRNNKIGIVMGETIYFQNQKIPVSHYREHLGRLKNKMHHSFDIVELYDTKVDNFTKLKSAMNFVEINKVPTNYLVWSCLRTVIDWSNVKENTKVRYCYDSQTHKWKNAYFIGVDAKGEPILTELSEFCRETCDNIPTITAEKIELYSDITRDFNEFIDTLRKL